MIHKDKVCDRCGHQFLHIVKWQGKFYCRRCYPYVTTRIPYYNIDGKLKIIKVVGTYEVRK